MKYPDDYINKVIQGDCLEVMKDIPDKSIDLVLTDPPYGIDLHPPRGLTDSIANDKRDDAQKILTQSLSQLNRILKEDSHVLIFGGWSEYWYLQEIERVFNVKSCIVWVKNNFGIGYYTRPQHEFIWYCHKGKPPVPEIAISDVIFASRVQKPVHSCEKPLGLVKDLITQFSDYGDTIIDPFLGSGTTAVAAKQLGRNFIGIEINPDYCKIAEQRLAQTELFTPEPQIKEEQMELV